MSDLLTMAFDEGRPDAGLADDDSYVPADEGEADASDWHEIANFCKRRTRLASEVDAAAAHVNHLAHLRTVKPEYRLGLTDCIPGLATLAENKVRLCVTSIPFGALFMYSGKTADIGNNYDGVDLRASHFGLHMQFFVEQLYRVMQPGGVIAIHIQQLIATKVQHGFMGRRDLRGAVVDLFTSRLDETGAQAPDWFEWKGEFVIPKNPQAMAQRLKLHSLLFVTGKRDATKLAPAMNDYVMIFRKSGDGAPVPALYDPEKNPGGWLTKEEWIRDAHGVWTDIRETDVLDGYRSARASNEEKHVCPLQLEVIRRLVRLYSNYGELVLDPFNGIGSTGVVALEQGRNYVGFELHDTYYAQSLRNLDRAMAHYQSDIDAAANDMPLLRLIEAATQPLSVQKEETT